MAGRRCPGIDTTPSGDQVACPSIIPAGTRYCTRHAQSYERQRGSRQQRGYDKTHDKLRAAYALRLARGATYPCARGCGTIIKHGDAWDLGHTDDRQGWTGPECVRCNRADGGKRSHSS